MPFKDNGRATIAGETTAGSSGQPLYKELGDGMRLWVSAKRQAFPDGSQFEGIGITPDIAFEMTGNDVTSENDALLERAMTLVD
jgi:carboxyl-terminal processing protease